MTTVYNHIGVIGEFNIKPLADLSEAKLTEAKLTGADLTGADLTGADLRWAELSHANLTEADLRGANLSFSGWPLWCGSRSVSLDEEQRDQLALYLYWVLASDDPLRKQLRERAQRAADERQVILD